MTASNRKAGMSLVELLCVIGIIAILAALYLSSTSKAFGHVVYFLKGLAGDASLK
jgi:prepilin-type N-terminal cleavage/methylation domain-containing protein